MKLVESRIASFSKDNPDAHCLPIGVMQLDNHPNPRKIVQTPDLVVILYEVNGEVRQIFTDGRALPTGDPEPQWSGYSVGKWEGDTLVVETSGFRDDGWLDTDGNPLSSAGKITERFRRLNYGNLEIEITVDDPKSYTKPWTIKVNQSIMLDAQLLDFFCQERDAQHYK